MSTRSGSSLESLRKRFVQKEVETSTAKLILGGQVSEGDTILLDVENGGLKAMIKPGVEVVDE